MVITGECLWDCNYREVLLGWYGQRSVGGMVLTGECWWDVNYR
jgi:hypothetical protein